MVIISAILCDKQGQILLARQFQPITQQQLKENVRNFPKLIQSTQQHTFVDFDTLRYLYTPMDQLYLLLLSTKNSNIIEDLEVLRILNRIIAEITVSISVDTIKNNTFEILLAIDDVISSGIRESTSVSQIQTALEMESSEEKLHIMLQKARENEAKEIAKKHQIEIEKKRQEELARKSKMPKQQSNAFQKEVSPKRETPVIFKEEKQTISQDDKSFSSANAVISQKNNVKQAPKKGMKLGKKKQENLNDIE